ncbi:hypothetical protein [Novosphingobium sp. KACC 22771]|uniref:hypothetical protein n=1 Tax=Novosphingobium sp. KACC 22771 TaxID=3025670 RepID=UPI0023668F91|nr:hypothetical protein [Novosphingobium sp. KACC 22771]WDF73282.1 hypothetical protein PQ467_04350 [Novosphingobium sp. KACC 22771]
MIGQTSGPRPGDRPGDRLRGGAVFVPRSPVGWQTMLADLSLILFMVTAAAMADVPDRQTPSHPSATAQAPAAPAISQPLAIWRPAPGGPELAQWLALQQADNRQLLSITLRYPPAAQGEALRLAAQLAASAGGPGARARIVIEPVASAIGVEAVAALAYDKGPA